MRPSDVRPTTVGLAAALIALLAAALCRPRAAKAERVYCVAHYDRLSAFEFLGFDECGTVWKLVLPRPKGAAPTPDSMGRTASDSAECWYWEGAAGSYSQVPCPAPGDTIGYVETGEK